MTLSALCLVVALVDANVKPLSSGPQVGAPNSRSGFRPQIVSGPNAGQRLCPV